MEAYAPEDDGKRGSQPGSDRGSQVAYAIDVKVSSRRLPLFSLFPAPLCRLATSPSDPLLTGSLLAPSGLERVPEGLKTGLEGRGEGGIAKTQRGGQEKEFGRGFQGATTLPIIERVDLFFRTGSWPDPGSGGRRTP